AFLAGPTTGDRQLAVGQEDHSVCPLCAGVDSFFELGFIDVPNGQLVMAARDDLGVVGGEDDGVDDHRELVCGRRRRRLPAEPQLAHQVGLGVDTPVELGAFLDPLLDNGNLLLGKGVAALLGRHSLGGGGGDKVYQVAVGGFAGGDGV